MKYVRIAAQLFIFTMAIYFYFLAFTYNNFWSCIATIFIACALMCFLGVTLEYQLNHEEEDDDKS